MLERFLDYVVITVNYVLWAYTLGAGFQCDWHTMLVAAAYHYHVLALHSQIASVNVGRNIHSCKVPYVYGAVGVWQRRGNESTCKFLFHISILLISCKITK